MACLYVKAGRTAFIGPWPKGRLSANDPIADSLFTPILSNEPMLSNWDTFLLTSSRVACCQLTCEAVVANSGP